MANSEGLVRVILRKINYYWRLFATGFSFFMFGLGGILIPIIVVPILYILPGSSSDRERRGQKFIHYAFRSFIGMMKYMGVLTYNVTDVEKLKKAKLILSNHPTLLDVVFLISFVPNANCVVKSQLMKNPVMLGALSAAGYIVNDEAAEDVISAAEVAFNKQHALIVFPEGTRTTPSQPIRLKRGAANIAIRTGADITPVTIECTPIALTKGAKWYQIPQARMHFQISVKDKIHIETYLTNDNPAKAARLLTKDLSNYFKQELGLHEQTAQRT